MKNLAYKTFFGKNVSHNDALLEKISSNISTIIAHEYNISEKSFKLYDIAINISKEILNENKEDIIKKGNEYLKNNSRLELLSEQIYDDNKNQIKDLFEVKKENINVQKFSDFINE